MQIQLFIEIMIGTDQYSFEICASSNMGKILYKYYRDTIRVIHTWYQNLIFLDLLKCEDFVMKYV